MIKHTTFESINEQQLDSVAGGLLDILNGSLNNNCISVLSNIAAHVMTGDIASKLLNIGNEIQA